MMKTNILNLKNVGILIVTEKVGKSPQNNVWRSNKAPHVLQTDIFTFISCPECENYEMILDNEIPEWKCPDCALYEAPD